MKLDQLITCTAWNLMGEYYDLVGETHLVRIKGGRALYEHVTNTRSDNIKLARLENLDNLKLKQINRYIKFDTIVELIPIEGQYY